MIDCEVAPLDQMLPVAEDDVSVTLWPWQKVVAPDAVIVGATGAVVRATTTGADGMVLHVPLLTETV